MKHVTCGSGSNHKRAAERVMTTINGAFGVFHKVFLDISWDRCTVI